MTPTTETLTQSAAIAAQPPAVIRCESTAEFLAALPFLTGYTAEDSLFLVLFSGRSSRGALRIDLPTVNEASHISSLVDAVCDILNRTGAGAERPAIVISSTLGFAESQGIPWLHLARMIKRRFRKQRWELREFACIAPDGWASYLDAAAPRAGRPLDELKLTPAAKETLGEAPRPLPLEDLGRIPEATPERSLAVARALTDSGHAHYLPVPDAAPPTASGTGSSDHLGQDCPAWVESVADLVDTCHDTTSEVFTPETCADIALLSTHTGSWLLLALGLLTRGQFIRDLNEIGDASRFALIPPSNPETRGHWTVQGVLQDVSHMEPNREKLRANVVRLSEAIAQMPGEHRPGPLALAAWHWWMIGLPSVAERLLETSQEIAPDHALSIMLRDLIVQIPPWRLEQEQLWSVNGVGVPE